MLLFGILEVLECCFTRTVLELSGHLDGNSAAVCVAALLRVSRVGVPGFGDFGLAFTALDCLRAFVVDFGVLRI